MVEDAAHSSSPILTPSRVYQFSWNLPNCFLYLVLLNCWRMLSNQFLSTCFEMLQRLPIVNSSLVVESLIVTTSCCKLLQHKVLKLETRISMNLRILNDWKWRRLKDCWILIEQLENSNSSWKIVKVWFSIEKYESVCNLVKVEMKSF